MLPAPIDRPRLAPRAPAVLVFALCILALGVTTGAPPAAGLIEPADDPEAPRPLLAPRLQPAPAHAALDDVAPSLRPAARDAWRAFVDTQADRGAWHARIDRRSGLVEIAEGAGVPWLPGRGNDLHGPDPRTLDDAALLRLLDARARAFADDVEPLLGLAGRMLRLDRTVSGRLGSALGSGLGPALGSERSGDHLQVVEYDVFTEDGLPIVGARVFFRVNHGNLVQWGASRMPPPGARAPTPRLDAQAALDAIARDTDFGLGRRLGIDHRDELLAALRHPPELVALPAVPVAAQGAIADEVPFGAGVELLTVWQMVLHRDGENAVWRLRVDAVDGTVLERIDLVRTGRATGGVWPVSWRVDGVEVAQSRFGWPFATLQPGGLQPGAVTDPAGGFVWDGAAQSARHTGRFVEVRDDCTISPAVQTTDADGVIDFGLHTPLGPADCFHTFGLSGNTPASRQQYWHLNQAMAAARAWLPDNRWLRSTLIANVNLPQNCNAFWNGESVNFFTSGGGCANTGEDAGVSLHEWGHGFDSFDGNGPSVDNGTGETYGDFSAALRTHDSCIGQGFRSAPCGGYGNPCTTCDGVRDIDWGRHDGEFPLRVDSFTQPICPSDGGDGYVGPCGLGALPPDDKEGHCESYVSSGALWDFAAHDLRRGCSERAFGGWPDWNCPGDGGPYDAATAWGVADRLWALSRPSADQAFTCVRTSPTWTSDGCNAGSNWMTMRFVDDDDGDLSNGTPHGCQLAAAFDRHGIACPSAPAWDVCHRACTPPAAPLLEPLVATDDGLELRWSDPGGDVVDIYRTELGCGAGMTKVADDVVGTTWNDVDVASGTVSSYRILRHPPGAEGCASELSACRNAAPRERALTRYLPGSARLLAVPTDGDGDGLLDNCDLGTVEVTIVNDSDAAQLNSSFVVSSPLPGVEIASALPIYGPFSLAPHATYTATFDARLDGVACGATLPFRIRVTTETDGVVRHTSDFVLELAEQDLAQAAARVDSFESDSDGWMLDGFARDSSVASVGTWSLHSSEGVDYACDQARSPTFRPSATAQAVLGLRYDIQLDVGGVFFDRAAVHAVDLADGSHQPLTPTGRPYDAAAPAGTGLCHLARDDGWAGGTGGLWHDAVLDLSGLDPSRAYALELSYDTDFAGTGSELSTPGDGIWLDDVRWSDVSFYTCDAGPDACGCTPPATPSGLATNVDITGQVTLEWSPIAGFPQLYQVLRADAPSGPWHVVSSTSGFGASSWVDLDVVPGRTYHYLVRAWDGCASGDSNVAAATVTGDCALAPDFPGAASIERLGAGTSCGLRVRWPEATSSCGGTPPVYNIYRSTVSGFTPSAANRVASCVTGTSWDDLSVTAGTTVYHYVVRAESAPSDVGAGPCRGGVEDANATEVRLSVPGGGPTTLVDEDFDTLPVGGLPDGWLMLRFDQTSPIAWRGARACSGSSAPHVLRYGGLTCSADYPNNDNSATATAQLGLPVGTTDVQGTFRHRWQLATGDFARLMVSSERRGGLFFPVYDQFLSGTTYTNSSGFRWLGTSGGYPTTMASTTVDLSAFCNFWAPTWFFPDCAGENLLVAWLIDTNSSGTADGWFVDDIVITADFPNCEPAAPEPVAALTATAVSGQVTLDWANPSAGGYATTIVRWSDTAPPATPQDGFALTSQSDGLGGHGRFVHGGLVDGQEVHYAVWVDNGAGALSARRTVSARPFDTTTSPVRWAYSTAASALAPPSVGSIYAVANDRLVHAASTGAGGDGTWPATWRPLALDAPVQSRPPIVPATVGGATRVLVVGSQDGRVTALDAETGTELWSTVVSAGPVQAAPAVSLAAFGGHDLVLVGTREAGPLAANALVALHLADGSVAWSFDNGGGSLGVGMVSSGAWIDYPSRVYFTSRSNQAGAGDSVWCLSFDAFGALLEWSAPLGDVDAPPTLRDGRLYAATVGGEIVALDAVDGSEIWRQPTLDGPVRGALWPDGPQRLLYSTAGGVHSLVDQGVAPSSQWSQPVASPSAPLIARSGGVSYLLVGDGDGILHQLELAADGTIVSMRTADLGGDGAQLAAPAYDPRIEVAYAGSESGRVYAVDLPLPSPLQEEVDAATDMATTAPVTDGGRPAVETSGDCVGVTVAALGASLFADGFESGDTSAWQPDAASWAIGGVLDLELRVELWEPVGDGVLHLDLRTPEGHLYQTLTAPFTTTPPFLDEPTAPADEPIAPAGTQRATGPPHRTVPGFRRPLPVQQATDGVVFRLPIAGTPIVGTGLVGAWTATPRLEGASGDTACAPPTTFRLVRLAP